VFDSNGRYGTTLEGSVYGLYRDQVQRAIRELPMVETWEKRWESVFGKKIGSKWSVIKEIPFENKILTCLEKIRQDKLGSLSSKELSQEQLAILDHDLQIEDPDLYTLAEIACMGQTVRRERGLERRCGERWLLHTVSLEIGKKEISLGHVLVASISDYERDDPRWMAEQTDSIVKPFIGEKSNIIAISIPSTTPAIEHAMKECEKLFAEIVSWDRSKNDVADLKSKVALLRYIFARASPYFRGSAAIGEWLEMASYGFHDFEICRYIGKGTVDLEALTIGSWSKYLEQYNKMLEIA